MAAAAARPVPRKGRHRQGEARHGPGRRRRGWRRSDGLSEHIHEEATTLSKVTPGADMDALARMYEQVVRRDGGAGPAACRPDERRAKLPQYVDRLSKAEQAANLPAAEAPPEAIPPLQGMARAAERGGPHWRG